MKPFNGLIARRSEPQCPTVQVSLQMLAMISIKSSSTEVGRPEVGTGTTSLECTARVRCSRKLSAKWYASRLPEVGEVKSGGQFTLKDQAQLIERASGSLLRGWGLADQPLPDY